MSEKLVVNLFGTHLRGDRPLSGREPAGDTLRPFHEYLVAQPRGRAMHDEVRQNCTAMAEHSHQARSLPSAKVDSTTVEAEPDAQPSTSKNALCLAQTAADVNKARVGDPRARHEVSLRTSDVLSTALKIPALTPHTHLGESAQDEVVEGATNASADMVRAEPVDGEMQHLLRSVPSGLVPVKLPDESSDTAETDTGRSDASAAAVVSERGRIDADYSFIFSGLIRAGQENAPYFTASESPSSKRGAVRALLSGHGAGVGQSGIISDEVAATVSKGAYTEREGISSISELHDRTLATRQPNSVAPPARRPFGEMALPSDIERPDIAGGKPQMSSGPLIGHSRSGVGENLAFAERLPEAGNGTMNVRVSLGVGDAMAVRVADMPAILPVDAAREGAVRISVNPAVDNLAPVRGRNLIADRLGSAVWAQVVEGIRNTTMRSLQIQLAPVELGRVRITMNPTDLGVQVVISADRLETLDLMRKFSADFEKALADIGYQNLDMTFSHHQTAEQNSFEAASAFVPDETSETAPVERIHTRLVENGMDIRI